MIQAPGLAADGLVLKTLQNVCVIGKAGYLLSAPSPASTVDEPRAPLILVGEGYLLFVEKLWSSFASEVNVLKKG